MVEEQKHEVVLMGNFAKSNMLIQSKYKITTLFQYPLPCGSDLVRACRGHWVEISIHTPLREWFKELEHLANEATFQYTLPYGSDSSLFLLKPQFPYNDFLLSLNRNQFV